MFKTVGDIITFIERHGRADLLSPRTRGSVTARGLDAARGSSVEEYRPEVGAVAYARYFRFALPEFMGARLGAVRLADLPEALRDEVRIRYTDEHGFELFVHRHEGLADLVPTSVGTFIVGPGADGALIPWTWFPGEPMGALSPATWGETFAGDVAVKLHNG